MSFWWEICASRGRFANITSTSGTKVENCRNHPTNRLDSGLCPASGGTPYSHIGHTCHQQIEGWLYQMISVYTYTCIHIYLKKICTYILVWQEVISQLRSTGATCCAWRQTPSWQTSPQAWPQYCARQGCTRCDRSLTAVVQSVSEPQRKRVVWARWVPILIACSLQPRYRLG